MDFDFQVLPCLLILRFLLKGREFGVIMSKISGVTITCNWKTLKKLTVAGALGLGLLAGWDSVKTAWQLTSFMEAVNVTTSGSGNSGSSLRYMKLPMTIKYGKTSKHTSVSREWKSFLATQSGEGILAFEKEFTVPQKEILSLVDYIIDGCDEDWSKGVDHLDYQVPENQLIDMGAPTINFRETRDIANLISGLSRYCVYKGHFKKAAQLLRSNVALVRQYISFRNANGGMVLIDSMICIAILRNNAKVLNSTNGLGGFSPEFYSIVRENLEVTDQLFSFCGRALQGERKTAACVFSQFNKDMAKKIWVAPIALNKEWMNERLNHYYPRPATFEKSFNGARYALLNCQDRIEGNVKATSCPVFYAWAILNPFKAVAEWIWTIAAPSWKAAYERECKVRGELRVACVNFALNKYKESKGEYPLTLKELADIIDEKMIIDPMTGSQFSYAPGSGRVTY
jgi:hypothetical protein